ITAGYNAGKQMTSLKHSDGDRLTLNYDTGGRLNQVIGPDNRAVTYTYDASGEHLTGISGAQGTYGYTYVTGQGAAREHALASVAYPDGTHTFFSFDVQGRLSAQSLDGGANRVTYSYLSPAGYTATDATGATVTILTDINGSPALIKDGLGHSTRLG